MSTIVFPAFELTLSLLFGIFNMFIFLNQPSRLRACLLWIPMLHVGATLVQLKLSTKTISSIVFVFDVGSFTLIVIALSHLLRKVNTLSDSLSPDILSTLNWTTIACILLGVIGSGVNLAQNPAHFTMGELNLRLIVVPTAAILICEIWLTVLLLYRLKKNDWQTSSNCVAFSIPLLFLNLFYTLFRAFVANILYDQTTLIPFRFCFEVLTSLIIIGLYSIADLKHVYKEKS